jgi:hypoxanthine phosphoribosyltransferase
LAKDVSASGFDPQCVLGVALGGVIPASIISVFLRRPLQTIRVKHYNGRKRLFCPEIVHEPDFVPQTSVLVVDDIIDSGGTLEKVRDFLDSRGVIDVRFATLHKKPSASFEPDWCVDVVTEWVDYPW